MKEYKLAKGWALFIYIFTPLLILLFGWMGFLPFLPGDDMPPGSAWFFVPLSLAMVLVLTWMLVDAIKGKVLLGEDVIKQVKVFGVRELRIEEVRAFTVGQNYITIFPLSKNKRKIRFSVYYANQQEIVYWLASRVPDDDEVIHEQEAKDFDKDDKYGFTPQERQTALQKATATNKYLSIAAVAVAVWAWFYPVPYIVPVLACVIMPLVLMIVVRLYKGLIRFDTPKSSLYPNWGVVLVAPAMALGWRAVNDYELLEYGHIWKLAVIIGLILVIGLMMQEPGFSLRRSRSWGFLLALAFCTCFYAYGSLTVLNAYFDRSQPEVYTATVTDMKKSSSNSGTTYSLYLTPWGERKKIDNVDVPGSLYKMLHLQDRVKVLVKKGVFGIPWYYVQK